MDATLVVDDDDIVLTVLSKVIDRAGIRYFATTDPTEALRLLSEGKFNLLVTDLVMDEVDGIELFCRAREQQPLLRHLHLCLHGSGQADPCGRRWLRRLPDQTHSIRSVNSGHLSKLRSSQAQTIFGPAKALGLKE